MVFTLETLSTMILETADTVWGEGGGEAQYDNRLNENHTERRTTLSQNLRFI